jgi:hypothetical protein
MLSDHVMFPLLRGIQNPRNVNTGTGILPALVGIFYSWPLAAWFLSLKNQRCGTGTVGTVIF